MLDACVYVLRSGCSWRMLPKDFPSWQAVYKTSRRWLARGLFEAMCDELRKLWRTRQHRALDPTAAVLDAPSVKTSPQGGPKGYDAGKKVKGRKRHLVTDTLELLLAALVTPASMQDRDAAIPVVEPGHGQGAWHQAAVRRRWVRRRACDGAARAAPDRGGGRAAPS